MKFLKNSIRFLAFILLSAMALYLFCALVAVPMLLPTVLSRQGSKIFKHPVKIRMIVFNPFLWQMTVRGLEIINASDQPIISFERLSVDVSFLSLLKKKYHVESIDLEQPQVHVSLMENGRIDLLDFLPASSTAAPEQVAVTASSVKPGAVPQFSIDRVMIQKGQVRFDDDTVKPPFKTVISDIDVTVTNFSTQPSEMMSLTLKAVIDERGIMQASAKGQPCVQPLDLDLTLSLDHYALATIGPYTGKYVGRNVRDGKLDFSVTYQIVNNQLKASHNVLIQRFMFGEKVESKDAVNFPVGFALALLEDSQGRIKISLPVVGDIGNPEFHYTHLIWKTVRGFFTKLVTKPFSMLGSILASDAGTEELGSVKFLPGQAELSSEEHKKLTVLAQSLKDRVKLLLEINGSYDLTADWKAIKSASFLKEYAAIKQESSRTEYWILQTLYQRRFGLRELWKLTRQFRVKGGYDYERLNPQMRRQLGEDAFPDKQALNNLADQRAKVVYDAILKERLDPRRVYIGRNQQVQASQGFVPMAFTLTVYDHPADETLEDLNDQLDQATVPKQ
ncbi:MAG: DUF748 domain-containing protein [Candidatus Omnitrophica bacterium]|nr:DUF748 domain-containing protein [Candidatus Omnitrophota bacterium]